MDGVYGAAEAYETAFSYRDIGTEVDALLRWYARHAGGTPGGVLELAAGPAEHARECARRGMRAAALDRSPEMCALAARRAAEASVPLSVHCADMTDFRLDTPVDLAFCMIDSIAHLLDLDALLAHLRAVRAHVRPGGCYVVEGSHPAEYLSSTKRVTNSWDVRRDGWAVAVRWGRDGDTIDPVTQVTRVNVTLTVTRDGHSREIGEVVPTRFWTATEMRAAAALAGWTTAGGYGDFTDRPLSDPAAWRMVTVLRRTGR